jgi:hypothetical protein
VIEAFRRAFGPREKATLVVKVSRGRSHPEAFAQLEEAARSAGVILVDEVLSRARAYGFIEMCDCFVSLHRAEGFGLCLAEAMLMGKPAIGTNYSGNLAFMHPGNSLLVDYELTDIASDNPIYKAGNHWAEPSVEHAASQMRYCFEHRVAAAELGAKGRDEVKQKLSLKATALRMAEQLANVTAFTDAGIRPARLPVETARPPLKVLARHYVTELRSAGAPWWNRRGRTTRLLPAAYRSRECNYRAAPACSPATTARLCRLISGRGAKRFAHRR